VDGRGCEWMELPYRPLFLSLLNLPPTTTMENKQVKRSLEQSFENEAKRQRGDRVGQLEHCMMNFYREDHEKQVSLKEAWAKAYHGADERASRLHRHGLQMANTIEVQARSLQLKQQECDRLERELFLARIAKDQMREAINNVIKDTIPYTPVVTKQTIRQYLECEIHMIEDDSTISDDDRTPEELQEIIDLTEDDEGYESDNEGLGLNNLDIQWPRGNI